MEKSLEGSGKTSGRRWDLRWTSEDGDRVQVQKTDGKSFQMEGTAGGRAWDGLGHPTFTEAVLLCGCLLGTVRTKVARWP